MRVFSVTVLLLLTAGLAQWQPRAYANDDPLPQIREALNRYYSTIHSISVTFETTTPGKPSADHKTQTKWAIDRGRKLYTKRIVPLDLQKPVNTRAFHSECDGTAYQISSFWPTDESRPKEIVKTAGQPIAPKTLTSESSFQATGLALWAGDENLASLLMRKDVVVEGQDDLDGSLCWRVNLGQADLQYPDANPHQIIVWLDPAVGFLMRRVSLVPTRLAELRDDPEAMRNFRPTKGDIAHVRSVKDFQKVADPIIGERWFPHELTFGPGDYARFLITEVAINTELPRHMFVPVTEFGTRLVDIDPDGLQNTHYAGGDMGEEEHERLIRKFNGASDNDRPTAYQPAPQVTSRTSTGDADDSSWSPLQWLFPVALLVTVAGFAVRTRKRRPARSLSPSQVDDQNTT